MFFNNPESLDVDSRAKVLSDLQLLIERDSELTDRLLRISQYLSSEMNAAPWETIMPTLRRWQNAVRGTDLEFNLKSYILELVSPIYDTLGWSVVGTDWDENILRSIITKEACESGHTQCIRTAKRQFNSFITTCKANANCTGFVHPDVQEPMFCAGVKSGMFDKLFTVFQSQSNVRPMTNIVGRMLYGLACTKQVAEQKKLIEFIMSSKTDRVAMLDVLSSRAQMSDSMGAYLKENTAKLVNDHIFADFVMSMTHTWTQARHLNMIKSLAQNANMQQYKSLFDERQNVIRAEYEWSQHQTEQLQEYLENERNYSP